MRKVVVSMFVSLDGVMEDPGGAESYEHGGWTRPFWDDGIGKFKLDELFAGDAMLLGRTTYEGFAKAWPTMKDEQGFADRMNGIPKFVVTKTKTDLAWNNSSAIQLDLATEVTALKKQTGKDILVFGSARLAQSLLKLDLVDELRLLVYPVVLGSGKRLFGDATLKNLKLAETKAFDSGVALLRYTAGKPEETPAKAP